MPLSKNSRRGLKYNVRVPGWNKGESHGNSKLTEDDVVRIKQLIEEGELTFADIAQAFAVTTGTISHIYTGRLWKHVSFPLESTSPSVTSGILRHVSANAKSAEESDVAPSDGLDSPDGS